MQEYVWGKAAVGQGGWSLSFTKKRQRPRSSSTISRSRSGWSLEPKQSRPQLTTLALSDAWECGTKSLPFSLFFLCSRKQKGKRMLETRRKERKKLLYGYDYDLRPFQFFFCLFFSLQPLSKSFKSHHHHPWDSNSIKLVFFPLLNFPLVQIPISFNMGTIRLELFLYFLVPEKVFFQFKFRNKFLYFRVFQNRAK